MSDSRKLTREQIWARIRESSKEEFILSEMKRLGFWPNDSDKPTIAEAFIEERDQLSGRLRELSRELAKVQDPEQALKLLHKERKEEALKRREETRRKRNAERFQQATDWHRRQQTEIAYLGQLAGTASGKSLQASLQQKSLDHGRLAAQSLPLIGNAAELASAMGITINELRFLCFQREVSTVSHYQRFTIPKKPSGERAISAPMPRLKRAQYWLLANVLDKIPATNSAHGFVKDRSIVSNAVPHVAKAVVVNMDLENFFPTITYRRIKGIYKQLGYSEEVATLCALLSSEPATQSYELDGQRYFVRTGEALLPQGAPTSPAISNLLCRRLDKRLHGMAAKLGFAFTRYADDLTFSGDATDSKTIKQLLWRARKILESEGLKVHPKKTHVMRKHQRQEVTGIVVNQRPAVCRKELKKFRALLFQIDKDGPGGKYWRTGSLFNSIAGYANFVAMVDPQKGGALQQQVAALKKKYDLPVKRGKLSALSVTLFRKTAAAGAAPIATWWQAQAKPAPVLELTPLELQEIKRKEKEALDAANPELQQKKAAAEQQRAQRTQANQPSARQPSRQQPAQRPGERPQQSLSGYIWFWLILSLILIVLLRR